MLTTLRATLDRALAGALALRLLIAGGVVLALAALAIAVTDARDVGESRGEIVYEQNCLVCHGVAGQGRIGPALNDLSPEDRALSSDDLAQKLTALSRAGIPGKMPMFTPDLISDDDMKMVAEYIVSIQRSPDERSWYDQVATVEPFQSTSSRVYFPQTGHSLEGNFLEFWRQFGGLRVFGYPITEPYTGIGDDGKPMLMQDFERARFEYHPDAPDGWKVQLGRLGSEMGKVRALYARRPMAGLVP